VHVINRVLVPASICDGITTFGANYSTFLSFIERTENRAGLALTGPLTLFAPTNTAFEALDDA
jgi:uncharacterized surface protein with fasciclin (FAS1) repeats